MEQHLNDNDLETMEFKDRRTVDSLLGCLEFLSIYYQRNASKESLIASLPIYDSSMNLENFVFSAQRIGLVSKVVTRPIEGISKLALPAVLLLEKNRACVVLELDNENKKAKVMIPGLSDGEITMDYEDLLREYANKVIIIKPKFNYETKVSRDIVIPEPKKWFWDTFKLNYNLYRRVIITAVLINLFVLAMPLFMKNVFDRVLPNNGIETLWAMAFGIVFILVLDLVLNLIRAYYLGLAGKKADLIMSNRIFDQLLNIRLSEKPSSTGQFVSRLQSFSSVRDFFTSATIATLVDIPFIVLFITVIFYFAGPLGWISVATLVFILGFSWIMQKRIKSVVEKSAKEEQLKQTTLTETVSGLEIIKSVRAQNRMKSHWDESLAQTLKYGEKSQFLSQVTTQVSGLAGKLSNIAVIIVGVYLAITGELSMGGIIAAMMLNSRVIAPISQIVGMVIRYEQTKLALENIDEIMQMSVERENKSYLSRPNLNGDIEFKDVNFSYRGQNLLSLKDVNINIKQGEKIAILGKIGSGKSTLAKILMNLYVPNSGSILIDNTDIRQVDPVDLRRSIGCVPQEPFLFMGSVKDNIRIGEQYVSDEEIIKASKAAGVHDFIGKHEAGYDLQVGERGEGLSGGEKQSVALARALITDPNILILDEPTNAMDKQTEKAFLKSLRTVVEDKTLIIISHKMSVLSLVDRVIVLDDGNVVADGTKEDIFRVKGRRHDD